MIPVKGSESQAVLPRRRSIPRIFLTYRIVDSQSATGRIRDHLEAKYGADNVFQDVEGIDPGAPWSDEIQSALRDCDVQLVMIGPSFLTVTDASGNLRLGAAQDWVAGEIEHGLVRAGRRPPARSRPLTLIPVAVDGATFPLLEDRLPEPLRGPDGLNSHEGVTLRNESYHADIRELERRIRRRGYYLLGAPKRVLVPLLAALVILAALAGVFIGTRKPGPMTPDRFNIAVADFETFDGHGKAVDSKLGHRFARALVQGLTARGPGRLAAGLTFDDELRTWGHAIGKVPAGDPSVRAVRLAAIVRSTGADLVIYGQLLDDGRITVPKPRLAFTPGRLSDDLIALLLHSYRPQPAPRTFPVSASPEAIVRPLLEQTVALERLLAGLTELRGDNWDDAAGIVTPLHDGREPGWTSGLAANPEREALVDQVLGTWELFTRTRPDPATDRADWYKEAEGWFDKALAADPTYDVARVSKFKIAYLRAGCDGSSIHPAGLDEMLAGATAIADGSVSVGATRTKASFVAGEIARCLNRAGLQSSDAGRHWYSRVIMDYEQGDADVAALAANSYYWTAVFDVTERFGFAGAMTGLAQAREAMLDARKKRAVTLSGTAESATGVFDDMIACVRAAEAADSGFVAIRQSASAAERAAFRLALVEKYIQPLLSVGSIEQCTDRAGAVAP